MLKVNFSTLYTTGILIIILTLILNQSIINNFNATFITFILAPPFICLILTIDTITKKHINSQGFLSLFSQRDCNLSTVLKTIHLGIFCHIIEQFLNAGKLAGSALLGTFPLDVRCRLRLSGLQPS